MSKRRTSTLLICFVVLGTLGLSKATQAKKNDRFKIDSLRILTKIRTDLIKSGIQNWNFEFEEQSLKGEKVFDANEHSERLNQNAASPGEGINNTPIRAKVSFIVELSKKPINFHQRKLKALIRTPRTS